MICINCGAKSPDQAKLSGCSMGGRLMHHDWQDERRPLINLPFDELHWRLDRLTGKLASSYATEAAFYALYMHGDKTQVLEGTHLAYSVELYREKAIRRAQLLELVVDEFKQRAEDIPAHVPRDQQGAFGRAVAAERRRLQGNPDSPVEA